MTPSYFAGIMDGEGAIMLVRTGQQKIEGMYTSFCLKIQIGNTNLELLSAICSSYGGMIRKRPAFPKNKNWKQAYVITWFGPDAMRILNIVNPELIVKRKVADLAYKYISFRENTPLLSHGYKLKGRGRSLAQIIELNKIAADVKLVNHRGVA